MSENTKKETLSSLPIPDQSRPAIHTFGSEKVGEKEAHTPLTPEEQQITGICRCCGQIAKNLINMRGHIRLKDGPKLWDWFIKFNHLQSHNLCQRYAHICTICLEKLVQAYKFHQQCLMAGKVFQVIVVQRDVARRNLAELQKLEMVNCKTCKKRIPAVFQNRHCQVPRRRADRKTAESRKNLPKAGGTSNDYRECRLPEPSLQVQRADPGITLAPVEETPNNYQEDGGKSSKVDCNICHKRIPAIFQNRHCQVGRRRHHVQTNGYLVCEHCGLSVRRKTFTRHYRTNHSSISKVVPCKICKKFFTILRLKFHMERVHNPQAKKHLCPICGDLFYETTELKWHVLKHSNPTPFECSKCDKKYATPNGLQNHVKKAHECRRYKCEVCGQIFITRKSLKNHVLLKHEGAKLQCHVCFLDTFGTVTTLTRHLRKFHQAKYDQSINFILTNNEKLMRHRINIDCLIQSCVVEENES